VLEGSGISPFSQRGLDEAFGFAVGLRGVRLNPDVLDSELFASAGEPGASAALRDRLMEELTAIPTSEEAVAWAYRSLSAKNTLTSADADIIDQAFRGKMQSVGRIEDDNAGSLAPNQEEGDKFDGATAHDRSEVELRSAVENFVSSDAALTEDNQNGVAVVKPVRKRDKAHRDFVCSQPCLVCGRRPSDAHHIQFGQPRALGRKVSDEFTVPLCRVPGSPGNPFEWGHREPRPCEEDEWECRGCGSSRRWAQREQLASQHHKRRSAQSPSA
jgi:hypothetical protein